MREVTLGSKNNVSDLTLAAFMLDSVTHGR